MDQKSRRGCLGIALWVWAFLLVIVLVVVVVLVGPSKIINAVTGQKQSAPTQVVPVQNPPAQRQLPTATPKVAPTVVAGLPAKPVNPTSPAAPSTPEKLPIVEIGVVPFAPYASGIGATAFGAQWGVEIRIVNMFGLESVQTDWVTGRYDPPASDVAGRILFTTQNSARMCADCEVIFAIGNSNGTDGIVVRSDITNWNQIFDYPVTGAGFCSVSEYFAKSFAWALGEQIVYIPADDAEPAMNAWIGDDTIKSVVLWEPFVSSALEEVEGSWVAIDTSSWAGIWDVAVIGGQDFNPAIQAATAAYFQFLKLEAENEEAAWNILMEWQDSHPENGALGYSQEDAEYFFPDLAGEAQADLRLNNYLFFVDPGVLTQRLQEAAEVLTALPCLNEEGRPLSVPAVDESAMLNGDYVDSLREHPALATSASLRNTNAKVTTRLELAEGTAQEQERIIASLPDVYVEFMPDSTDYKNQAAAISTIGKTYAALLRLSDNTVVELVGGYAFPGSCPSCTDQYGRELAEQRAEKVRMTIIQLFNIDESRVRLARTTNGEVEIRQPEHRGTLDARLLNSDRRVEGRILLVGGQ